MATEPAVNSSADVSVLPEAQAVSTPFPPSLCPPWRDRFRDDPHTIVPPHISFSCCFAFADSTPLSSLQQIHDDAQPGHPGQHLVNGTSDDGDNLANKHITSVDYLSNSADVSVSGGSDTEASRKDGDKGHGRTSSTAKKPATFKAVSVNKTFLAAKANATTASSKLSDKPAPGSSTPPTGSASLSASRPRLVAKTGSGARDSVPRFSAIANGRKPAAAPDPSVVWNKNRPVPVPEPKKFTDEELKKYGIHMASRLNEEDTSGQNKWADIDDDDEDWAPETITWGDGTKTTLPHPDEHPMPLPTQEIPPPEPQIKVPEKPRSPAPPPVVAPSPVTKSSGLASGKGLVLKSGGQEKPTLVSKPTPPPGPAKSPWATLPPVEKTPLAPVDNVPAPRGPPMPFKSNVPMKEIAADDFSRSTWRDSAPPGGRELYNSQSGRYEPVPDRRGSARADTQPKQPALLQRTAGPDHPAEPSSAFQTSRNAQDIPFGRRRGSSNVSGGSGTYMQRSGKPYDPSMPPPEVLTTRRISLTGSIGSPVTPEAAPVSMQGHPRQQPPHGFVPRSSPGAAFATPYGQAAPAESNMPPPLVPTRSLEDDLEYQKKLMRERVEEARKRRQDEEAREEAARRERIQKKLDALGPAPEKKSEKKEPAPKDEASKTPRLEHSEVVSSPVEQTRKEPSTQESKAERDSAKAASPNSHVSTQTPGPRRPSHDAEPKQSDLWGGPGPRPDRLGPWAPSALPPPSRNVWGSPDKDRALGNGTFNPDLSLIAGSSPAHPPTANGPPPIAPPSGARVPSQGRSQQPPIGSRASRYGGPVSDLATKWVAAVADKDKQISAAMIAERTEQERQLAERGLTMEDAQPAIKDTWRPVQISGEGMRRPVASVDVQSHHSGPWRTSRDELANATPGHDVVSPVANAGVIGSGSNSILKQPGQAGPPQPRGSRFFPTKDARYEPMPAFEIERPNSPTPPPPTMEGHPAYEGDVLHPHVSLPKPHPVVKLPPVAMASQLAQSRNAWTNPSGQKDAHRQQPAHHHPSARSGEQDWQNRINNLLNGNKGSPPKASVVDPASKSALDHHVHYDSATVSLPTASRTPGPTSQLVALSKPPAEECFEEQEMGSLPQIRLPHQPAYADYVQPDGRPDKSLPKKFNVHATSLDAYYFSPDVVGGGTALKIRLPNMTETKIATLPFAATRGGSRSSQTSRGARGRGGARGSKREVSSSHGERSHGERGHGERSHGERGHGERGHGERGHIERGHSERNNSSSSRSTRGSYRGRGTENWSRQASAQSSTPA
jgi:hypothetical protein